jgi:GNAT superfamily N-acetyltransferase
MSATYYIRRNVNLAGKEVEDLRGAVGWDRMDGHYDRILKRSYTHFSAHENDGRLIGFVDVISEGIADAFLVDLMVHPDYQGRGVGKALVLHAIDSLRADGILTTEVIFEPRLESFYRACGFEILQSGIIENKQKK